MKKLMMFFVAAMVAFSFATVSFATGDHKVSGEVTKVEGDMVTVKDDKGKEHKIHTDKSTKTTGDIKQGAKVDVDMTDKGHATAISAKK
ncbi:MAG: hypothetical protein HY282_06815 [Nitrospirae bacterium]|nr:hypothetical protein [Candidatus Manganitrophaceae bacterium]